MKVVNDIENTGLYHIYLNKIKGDEFDVKVQFVYLHTIGQNDMFIRVFTYMLFHIIHTKNSICTQSSAFAYIS